MSDNKNNEEKIELKIGNPYIVTLKSGSIVTGVLVTKTECMTDNGVLQKYKIGLGGTVFVDITENDIEEITEIQVFDLTEYFQEFEEKYNIKCFKSDGELLSSSSILNNILSKNGLWDGLSQEEKEELMNHLRLDAKNIIDLITALISYRKENKKLHDGKLKILDTATELMQNYNAIKKVFTDTRDSYNVFFNMLGMDQFIKEICK